MAVDREPRYDVSAVRTLAAALGRPANAHDYVLSEAMTGRVKGVYATEQLACAALKLLVDTPGVHVLTVLHPDRCGCPEAA